METEEIKARIDAALDEADAAIIYDLRSSTTPLDLLAELSALERVRARLYAAIGS